MDRSEPGPDSAFSLEPAEFRQMVDAVRTVERALGHVSYEPTERERGSRMFRRSLFVVQSVERGEPLTEQNIRSIRPGNGLAPKHLSAVLGRRAIRELAKGEPLDWSMME